jgi:hypothetical protein
MISPSNKAFHNLCENLTPPSGTRQLLGLGLKFCLEKKQHGQRLQETITTVTHDVRLCFEIQQNIDYFKDNSGEYNPRLYIKSGFTPTKASGHVEL